MKKVVYIGITDQLIHEKIYLIEFETTYLYYLYDLNILRRLFLKTSFLSLEEYREQRINKILNL
jgi:hypothetical protein